MENIMKITIPRQDLLDAVNKVKSVVSSKSALPILSHILLDSGDACVKLAATDLKVSIECSVDCTVHSPGAMTISSQRLSSMLSEMPNEDITLNLTDNNIIEITCGRIDTKLFSMSPDEFPPIRNFEGIEPLTFTQSSLKRLFLRSSFAICSDQARYNLTGLLFEIVDGKLTVVATDGRRMSLNRKAEGVPDDVETKIIIPSKMIHELERLLDEEDPVQVYLDESQISFVFNNLRMVSALIEGTFPNYNMVIPAKHDKEILVNRERFVEAVRRTRTMTNDKFNSVRFGFGEGMMTLKVVTPEVGEYEEELPIDYDGEVVEIAFNPDFVLDVLRRIETEQVAVIVKDAMSPGILKPNSDAPDDMYVNVVMPIRI
jgi:DNA polymerase III subunit beta